MSTVVDEFGGMGGACGGIGCGQQLEKVEWPQTGETDELPDRLAGIVGGLGRGEVEVGPSGGHQGDERVDGRPQRGEGAVERRVDRVRPIRHHRPRIRVVVEPSFDPDPASTGGEQRPAAVGLLLAAHDPSDHADVGSNVGAADLAPTGDADDAELGFVELREIPFGPWRKYGANNHFLNIAKHMDRAKREEIERLRKARDEYLRTRRE